MRRATPTPREVLDLLPVPEAERVDPRRCGHHEPWRELVFGAGRWWCCLLCGTAIAARTREGRLVGAPSYCPVPGCGFDLPRPRILCGPHWFMVPAPLRAAVWREYRRGPGRPAHEAAVRAAIEAAREEAARRGGNRGGARRP